MGYFAFNPYINFQFLFLWWFKHVKRIKDLVVMWKADCLKEKWNMKLWNKKEIQTFDKMRKTENLKKYSWQRWSKRLFFVNFKRSLSVVFRWNTSSKIWKIRVRLFLAIRGTSHTNKKYFLYKQEDYSFNP